MDLSTLNVPQRDAVLHDRGPLVVFAGAGSGKTRVITHRIARLVSEEHVPAWRILAVTFTNKAAGEMRERLEKLVPGRGRDLAVGTFHSICARILRKHADALGLRKDFVIYDDSDQKAMITRVVRDLKYDEKRFPTKLIAGIINSAKNEMQTPEEVPSTSFDAQHLRLIFAEYEKRMRAASALDFGDLIYRLVLALEADEALRVSLADRYLHVLVDEFQDTNHAQFRLVRALSSIHRNLVVVGDDDQSIYRWRGADRRNILDFRRYFPDAEIVKLEQNYRSTKRILRASYAVIKQNADREPKELWTDNGDGEPVRIVRCGNERDEADLVVRTARAIRNDGRRLAELAIFYRTHAQSRVLEEALRAAKIAYRVVGGVRFYDRAEVKDLLAYLRVLANPDDDVSLLRIINTPARGIGKTTIEKLLDEAAARGVGVHAIAEEVARKNAALGRFMELLTSLRGEATSLGLTGLARAVLERSGYAEALRREGDIESETRLQNLEELVGSMEEFESAHTEGDDPEGRTLSAFLESVALQSGPEEGGGDPTDLVTLMTVHAAKGLEFPDVIVIGMEEQLFPFRGLEPGSSVDEMEEERRLAYVAFTRAEARLTLTWATSRYVFGNPRIGVRSRFLDELPAADIVTSAEGGPAPRPFESAPVGSRPGTPYGGYYGQSGVRSPYAEASPRESASSEGDEFRGERRSLRGISSPPAEVRVERDIDGFHRGMQVRHARYGVGRVKAVEAGAPPKVTVDFPQHGQKQIVAKYLDPV